MNKASACQHDFKNTHKKTPVRNKQLQVSTVIRNKSFRRSVE